jgi:hypothetical protein
MNKPEVEVEHAPAAAVVVIPEPDSDWHPAALAFYRSLAASGQSVWYEPSDWSVAWYTASLMSVTLADPYAPMVARVQAGFTALMATEGDRRRLRIELERAKAKPTEADGVARLDDYRDRLSG